MKSQKSINNTLKAAIFLTFFLLLIFGKNLLERKFFNELGQTFISVYDDRLVVESYIFSISENLFRIKLLVNHCEIESDYNNVIEEIQNYELRILSTVDSFEQTKLTKDEGTYLTDFKNIIENSLRIDAYELLYSDQKGINAEQVKKYNLAIENALRDLEKLSQIQIEEGKKLVGNSERIVNRSKIWEHFEVAALVVLIILIYILILTSLSIKTNSAEK